MTRGCEFPTPQPENALACSAGLMKSCPGYTLPKKNTSFNGQSPSIKKCRKNRNTEQKQPKFLQNNKIHCSGLFRFMAKRNTLHPKQPRTIAKIAIICHWHH